MKQLLGSVLTAIFFLFPGGAGAQFDAHSGGSITGSASKAGVPLPATPKAVKAAPVYIPKPAPPRYDERGGGDKWWSVSFFGDGHKAVTRAALALMDKNEFPDIARAQSVLVTGGSDESGHADKKDNGGKTDELWYGRTPFSKGGVLTNYRHFKFPEAYEKIGVICHLTQDQATPTHAANIGHYTGDSFEGYTAEGNKVKIAAARDNGEMEPYAYYQDLQDDTRRHLASWVHPRTGKPYWVPAADAPPLGQDVTFGPAGSYGPDGDVYSRRENTYGGENNNSQQITDSPEIRLRQLGMAGASTVGVLKSASKRLPPLVSGLSVTPGDKSATVRFTIFENRSRKVSYSLSLCLNEEPCEKIQAGEVELKEPASPDLMLKGEVSAALDLSAPGSGNYTLDARVTDGDGNVTPDEVNSDDIRENDTRIPLAIP